MADGKDGAAPAATEQVVTQGQGADQGGGDPGGAPDDGFTPEERAEFETMRKEPAGGEPAPADGDAGKDGGAAPAAGADSAAAAAAAGDDDDGEDDAAAAGAAGAPAAGDKQPRRVSFNKYKRETDGLRKQIEDSNRSAAEKDRLLARLDERIKIINEALSTPPAGADGAVGADGKPAPKAAALPKAEDDPEPNMEEDIFAWNQWNRRELLRDRQARQDERAQQQTVQQTVQQQNSMHDAYLEDANTYAAENPNFLPAYQYLIQNRALELAEYYFGKDLSAEGTTLSAKERKQIEATIADEERGLVASAIKSGQRPAERVFKLAKARGYRPTAADAAADGGKPAAGNGAAAANGTKAAANGAATTTVRDEIERVKAGQNAALSLSDGGGAPVVTLDAKKLADMPEEEFGALVDSLTPTEYRKLFGG